MGIYPLSILNGEIMLVARPFNPKRGYSVGPHLFYKCLLCGDVLPSLPPQSTKCTCGNIQIDTYDARMGIRDHSKACLLEETGHPILHALYAVMDCLNPPISYLNKLYLKLTRLPRLRR